jgi:hypothetical protein
LRRARFIIIGSSSELSDLGPILRGMTDNKAHPAAADRQTMIAPGPTEIREGARVIISPGLPADYEPPSTAVSVTQPATPDSAAGQSGTTSGGGE